jgi:hypothetical protein
VEIEGKQRIGGNVIMRLRISFLCQLFRLTEFAREARVPSRLV